MISKEEVFHIAKLARLGLAEKGMEKFQKELSKILDYIEKLEEIDISGVEPTSHSFEVENVTREDKECPCPEVLSQKLLGLAPKTERGYVKVKSIITKSK